MDNTVVENGNNAIKQLKYNGVNFIINLDPEIELYVLNHDTTFFINT